MMIINCLVMLMPWFLKKWILKLFYRYDIADGCFIGLSYIFPARLVLKSHAQIGHLSLCKGLDLLRMGEHSSIGRFNWITGYPSSGISHFTQVQNRQPILLMGDHCAITHRHIIDCTDKIELGDYATVGGYYTQFLTHSIDFLENRQSCSPITIGRYTFVGTSSVILRGASLPNHSVLAAKSLLNQCFEEEWHLYGGVPAKLLKGISAEDKYFSRKLGFVD